MGEGGLKRPGGRDETVLANKNIFPLCMSLRVAVLSLHRRIIATRENKPESEVEKFLLSLRVSPPGPFLGGPNYSSVRTIEESTKWARNSFMNASSGL